MLTSELITLLQKRLEKDGDLPVYINKDYQRVFFEQNIFVYAADNVHQKLPRRLVIV